MDINRINFLANLLNILKVISKAEFVAVDLEMSGIQVDKPSTTPVVIKPTLQGAYEEARSAAMLYTILQFGFTCISWDPNKKSYVTETFNIPLHPGVRPCNCVRPCKESSCRLYSAMKRSVTISTKSLGFLEYNQFDFSGLFQRGVPYMSSAERESKEVVDFIDGQGPAKEETINVLALPKAAMEFRNGVEMKVSAYQEQLSTGGRPTSVKIDNTSGHRLNTLQRRLVHELLQDKFPALVAFSQGGGRVLEIVKRGAPLPDSIRARQRRQRSQAVRTQIGARILWDAICGQPFVLNIDSEAVARDSYVPLSQVKAELEQYERRLRNKSPILVGHNILMDLCFLQSNFVRPLPDSLQEFRAITRERLPRIVDTKYLFTRGGDEMSADYSLLECFADMHGQQLPAVVSSHRHPQNRPHQAGYDSYMTAIVFLKKAYQLAQSRDRLWYIASEDLGEGEAIRSLPEERDAQDDAKLAKGSVLQPQRRGAAPATAPPTPKQSLEQEREREPEQETEPEPTTWRNGKSPARVSGKIPEWGREFWGKYGNRTRIGLFGFILYMPKMAEEKMPED